MGLSAHRNRTVFVLAPCKITWFSLSTFQCHTVCARDNSGPCCGTTQHKQTHPASLLSPKTKANTEVHFLLANDALIVQVNKPAPFPMNNKEFGWVFVGGLLCLLLCSSSIVYCTLVGRFPCCAPLSPCCICPIVGKWLYCWHNIRIEWRPWCPQWDFLYSIHYVFIYFWCVWPRSLASLHKTQFLYCSIYFWP